MIQPSNLLSPPFLFHLITKKKKESQLTKQLRPIPSRTSEQLLLTSRMKLGVRRDVVDFAVERRPSVVGLVVELQLGRRDALGEVADRTLEETNGKKKEEEERKS